MRHGVSFSRRVAALVVASVCTPAPAQAAPYAIDPTHTFVYFELAASALSTLRGRFDRSQGEVEFDRLGRSASVEVRLETRSVSTGIAALDAQLCAPEGLDCDTHPQAVFRAARFSFGDSGLPTQVTGNLTLRGKTLPITLSAQHFNCYPNLLLLREVCGGDFEAVIEPAAFGIETNGGAGRGAGRGTGGATGLPERITLLIQIEAVKQ
jgi:polyisoprenoid-binding protein YceI